MYISAIIPAYNEEGTIAGVLDALESAEAVDEIIVVSDGSEDATASVAQNCGAKVVKLASNMGKGAAVKKGLAESKGEIILFLDADLIGLQAGHIKNLLEPVTSGQASMSVGVFSSGRVATNLAHRISPCLSGQRAVKRYILDGIENMGETGYGLEMALTAFVEKENISAVEVELTGVTHVMKEEKMGIIKGFGERMKMYWEVCKELAKK